MEVLISLSPAGASPAAVGCATASSSSRRFCTSCSIDVAADDALSRSKCVSAFLLS